MARYPRNTGTRPVPRIRLEPERALTRRTLRNPSHTFRVKIRPWQLVPTCIAPLLPGDTIKRASFKARVLSKPLKDKLSGWWFENYLFYVRLGDMSDTDQADFKDMILTGNALNPGPFTSADPSYYKPANKWGFVGKAYALAVEAYFRNEDSTTSNGTIGDYSCAKIAGPGGLFDSLAENDNMDPVPDDADEWVKKYEAWTAMSQERLTTASWEEYLAANGVALPPQLVQREADRKPEILHYTRDWQFPVQAIEPSTGVPSSIVQWSQADRLRRGRFCAEPGFVLGMVCARPKSLLKNQRGSGTDYLMDDRSAWFDPQFDTDPHNRLRMFDGVTVGGGAGPVWGSPNDYWVDPGDLFSRGDQFTNYDLGSTVSGALDGLSVVDLPAIDGSQINTLYPQGTDADALFSGSDKFLEVDGVYSFGIASRAGRGDATGKRAGMT